MGGHRELIPTNPFGDDERLDRAVAEHRRLLGELESAGLLDGAAAGELWMEASYILSELNVHVTYVVRTPSARNRWQQVEFPALLDRIEDCHRRARAAMNGEPVEAPDEIWERSRTQWLPGGAMETARSGLRAAAAAPAVCAPVEVLRSVPRARGQRRSSSRAHAPPNDPSRPRSSEAASTRRVAA